MGAKETRHLHTNTPVPRPALPTEDGHRPCLAKRGPHSKETSSPPATVAGGSASSHTGLAPTGAATTSPGPSPGLQSQPWFQKPEGQRQHAPETHSAEEQINTGTHHHADPPPPRGKETKVRPRPHGRSAAPRDRGPGAGHVAGVSPNERGERMLLTCVLGPGTFPPHVVYGPQRLAWEGY